jgi:hypothetical protein
MPDRAGNDFAIVRAAARVVPLRAVNERLRSDWRSQPARYLGCQIKKNWRRAVEKHLTPFLRAMIRKPSRLISCSMDRANHGPQS